MWCRVYLSARESRQVSMCRCDTLTCCPCPSSRAIPQPMPLPKVPIGVLCLSAHNFGKADITRRRRVTSLISDIPIRKIAPSKAIFFDFSCIYQKLVVPSNICLPTAFPRSYVRIMQPILQPLTLLIRKSASPYCTLLSQYYEQALIVI